MAYVYVDHSKFEAAAQAVDTFVSSLKKNMNLAKTEVDNLSANWHGTDFLQFKSQWSRLTMTDSTYAELIKSLESYADFLRFAAKKYKDTQIDAVNEANRLPKY